MYIGIWRSILSLNKKIDFTHTQKQISNSSFTFCDTWCEFVKNYHSSRFLLPSYTSYSFINLPNILKCSFMLSRYHKHDKAWSLGSRVSYRNRVVRARLLIRDCLRSAHCIASPAPPRLNIRLSMGNWASAVVRWRMVTDRVNWNSVTQPN